ncbi:MAG TPA: type II toxin-antitoxin system VapC family toxin [Candidatus Dormibacteraeota bacterium]|nr:type II toxin-antitoxin system VapC family toxin [Candidatus Dormibacteraeota bacterium]
MLTPDVNVLVYAHREDAPDHLAYRSWLEQLLAGPAPFGLAELVLAGFLRVVTHPRIFSPPTPLEQAFKFANQLQSHRLAVVLRPGTRHWGLFVDLARAVQARGNLLQDAYLAALAIESGSEWVTADRDFSRFPGLAWRHPLAPVDD